MQFEKFNPEVQPSVIPYELSASLLVWWVEVGVWDKSLRALTNPANNLLNKETRTVYASGLVLELYQDIITV